MGRDAGIFPRWCDGFIIMLAAGLMLAWTWRTWPDPLVDFGRELYVPWQITMGRVLYRDIAYFNGPLSPYVNALWMRLFGVSLTTLIVANLAVVAAILALLYALLDAAASRITALGGDLLFVAIFLVTTANYNFVCPYSHEITHGIALSLGALACLFLPQALRTRNVAATGLLTGLVLLTKVEVALACLLAVAAGFALRIIGENPLRWRKLAAVLLGTALTPGILAFALLSLRMPMITALKGVLGSSYWALASNVASLPFYRAGLGVDNVPANLAQIGVGTALVAAGALVASGIAFLTPRIMGTNRSRPAALLAFAAAALLGMLTLRSPHWCISVPKALPLAMGFLVVVWFLAFRRESRLTGWPRVLALRLALSLFALGLLAKMILNTRIYDYGFALSMPATLLLLAAFTSWAPRFLAARGADGGVVCAIGLTLACAIVFANLTSMSPLLKDWNYQVGLGSDAFLAPYERGLVVQIALAWVDKTMPPGATFAVLPEGAMINYLSRRSNSTPYVNLMPPEVVMFGENRILRDFKARPPDFVLLCHKDTTEYGLPLFGHDYGQSLAAWIRDNYDELVLIGDRPLKDPQRFGMLLLRRRNAGAF